MGCLKPWTLMSDNIEMVSWQKNLIYHYLLQNTNSGSLNKDWKFSSPLYSLG